MDEIEKKIDALLWHLSDEGVIDDRALAVELIVRLADQIDVPVRAQEKIREILERGR